MTRLYLVLALAAVLGAVPGAAATPRSGLFGVVTEGPIMPVCIVESACSGPAAHVKLVFVRHGSAASRVTTDRAGKYRLVLPAGRYTVQVAGGRPFRPTTALVRPARFHRVDFLIDTGIR